MIIWVPLKESSWKWANQILYHGSPNKFSSIRPSIKYGQYSDDDEPEGFYSSISRPPAIFLTLDPIFALLYANYEESKQFNRDGYIYKYKLKNGLNIFDIANKQDKNKLLNYFKKNVNNQQYIKKINDANEWDYFTMETSFFQWGLVKAGFDGWTYVFGYSAKNNQPSRHLGIWNAKMISKIKIIPVEKYLDEHPEYIDLKDPLKVRQAKVVSPLKINLKFNITDDTQLISREMTALSAIQYLYAIGNKFPTDIRSIPINTLGIQLSILGDINKPITSRKLINYLNRLHKFLISRGVEGNHAVDFSINWFKYIGLIT
jgi:hypothetical protein